MTNKWFLLILNVERLKVQHDLCRISCNQLNEMNYTNDNNIANSDHHQKCNNKSNRYCCNR
jgi:hypothetical protein